MVDSAPKVAIRGDLYANGTIAGIKMVADTITTRELAANSITADKIQANAITTNKIDARAVNAGKITLNNIDIEHIIDGAASNTTAAAGTSGGGGGTICSVTITTKAGRAIIWATVYPVGTDGGARTASLYVDGGLVRSQTNYPAFLTGGGGIDTYTAAPNIVIMHYVTGLGDGNHTFLLSVNDSSTPGTIIVNNPRR
jgi:hypothetical protein